MIGEGPGQGYNINVPWEHGRCGDADYLAVWDHVLIPVAESFNPDIILVSAGFDAGLPLNLNLFNYSVLFFMFLQLQTGCT
jgi:histone deacetylase 4/5